MIRKLVAPHQGCQASEGLYGQHTNPSGVLLSIGDDDIFEPCKRHLTMYGDRDIYKLVQPSAEQAALPAARPHIICLCGSTRFIEQFAIQTWELERQGNIVLGCTLLPLSYCKVASHFGEATGTKQQCDELHLRKIDMADEVIVLNYGGYIGESTRNEIAYAKDHGKPVRYIEQPPAAPVEVLRITHDAKSDIEIQKSISDELGREAVKWKEEALRVTSQKQELESQLAAAQESADRMDREGKQLFNHRNQLQAELDTLRSGGTFADGKLADIVGSVMVRATQLTEFHDPESLETCFEWAHTVKLAVDKIRSLQPRAATAALVVDDLTRCALCGWPLAESVDKGCVRGNCSMRPLPNGALYSRERARAEYHGRLDSFLGIDDKPTAAPTGGSDDIA